MSKTITGVLLIFLLGFVSAFSQNISDDHQETSYYFDEQSGQFQEIPQTPAGVDSLLALGNERRNSDSRMSFHAAREALRLSREIGYEQGEAQAHNLAGIKYADFGDYDHALEHYLEAMEIEERLGNREVISDLQNNIGLIHLEQQNYEQAAENLTNSIELKNELGLQDQTYLTTNNLGVIYRRQGEYDKALTYFKEAEQLSLEVASDSLIHMIATMNIGNTYRNKGNLEQSEPYLNKAARYFEATGNKNFLSASYLVTGRLNFDRSEYEQALLNAEESLQLARDENLRERMKDAHELLVEIHEANGDYEKAYTHLREFHELHDVLLDIQRSNQINQMQIQFEVEQKDREIQLLNQESALQEAEIAQQKLWRNFSLLGLLLFSIIGGLLYKYNNQKKRANKLLEKKNREIKEQNEKLVRLNEEKDEFLGMAAHDLRSPLSGIKSCISLLTQADNVTEKESEQYFELIETSVDRMVTLINNLLDVNSFEHGSPELEAAPLDIRKPLKNTVDNFKKVADEKNIHVNSQIDPNLKPVLADKAAIRRVLENLISNAIKFSPPGSEVKVTARIKEKHLELSVKDNGPGIPEEEQDKLFKRFSRLSNKPTGNESTTGLGLFIVKKLVEAMDSSICCESTPGKGTAFVLTFPVAANRVEVQSR